MEQAEKEQHIKWLDGLRGLAIVLVLIGHFFIKYYICNAGWIGVNLFFILSGYLITGRLFWHAVKDGGRFYFRNFYGRRVLRIFPLYYACLIAFFVILPFLYGKYSFYFGRLYEEQWWYWAYLSNWRIVLQMYPDNHILDTLWSLAVEEQFYLVWPFLFLYMAWADRKIVIGCLWLLSIVVRVLSHQPYFLYYNTLTAAEPLLMGALLCILEKEGRLPLDGSFVICLVVAAILGLTGIFAVNGDLTNTNEGLMRWGYTGVDILLTFLLYKLIVKGMGTEWLRGIFSWRWLRWMGERSYGFYIFHWFILQMLVAKWYAMGRASGMEDGIASIISTAGGILLMLVLGSCSYRYFERPLLRFKKYFE